LWKFFKEFLSHSFQFFFLVEGERANCHHHVYSLLLLLITKHFLRHYLIFVPRTTLEAVLTILIFKTETENQRI
jgi:hypothetical protein